MKIKKYKHRQRTMDSSEEDKDVCSRSTIFFDWKRRLMKADTSLKRAARPSTALRMRLPGPPPAGFFFDGGKGSSKLKTFYFLP
jgi:hypothetical protein